MAGLLAVASLRARHFKSSRVTVDAARIAALRASGAFWRTIDRELGKGGVGIAYGAVTTIENGLREFRTPAVQKTRPAPLP